MPVTRNRLSNQRSSASSSTTAVATQSPASSTSIPAISASSTDDADSESRSQNSNNNSNGNNHLENTASPVEQSRQLRDRNSLSKPSHIISSQQQHLQLDADRTTTPELDGLNLSRKSKSVQPPTRVLPKRSTTRPQSLLLKETSSTPTRVSVTDNNEGNALNSNSSSNNINSANNHQTKRFKTDISSGSIETRPPVANRGLNRMQNGNDFHHATSFDVRDGGVNQRDERHRELSSHITSLLSSSTAAAIRSAERHANQQHLSPVSISLPSNASTSSGLAANNLNGLAHSAKRVGLLPVAHTQLDDLSFSSSGAVNLSLNRVRTKIHQQLAPSHGMPQKRHFNILIAVTGSVASVKLIELIRVLMAQFPRVYTNRADNKTYEATISIRVLMTENSKHFVDKNNIAHCVRGKSIEVFEDADEWSLWGKMGDPVLHIELRKWADLMLIAPLDANTMAKMATGICDNLLTSLIRAWDTSKKLIYCPAMNVHMYEHPITREHLCKLQAYGYLRVDCIEKRLACGDVGLGAMATVSTIVDRVVENLLRPIPRLTSPIKSLLNHQPTYPIMSTTSETPTSNRSSNNSALNLIDRLSRSNSQAHLMNSMQDSTRSSITSIRNGIAPGQSLLSGSKPNNLVMARSLPQLKNINGNINDLKKVTVSQPSGRPNFVKSLKNLKAINPDLSLINTSGIDFNDDILDGDDDDLEGEDDDDDDGEDDEDNDEFYEANNLDQEPEDYDIDPTRMLEQSLITDEDNSFGNDGSRRGSLQHHNNNNNSSASNNSNWVDQFQRTESNYSPLFNTSKFLTMCYVKDRNCFNCAICKNDYKNRKSMSRHLREQHVQGNIYKCVPCDVGFKRREKLMKHNRDKHQM